MAITSFVKTLLELSQVQWCSWVGMAFPPHLFWCGNAFQHLFAQVTLLQI